MPRVEYNPVPEARPKEIREPERGVHIDFPSVPFTGAVGKALEDLGHGGLGVLGAATSFAGQQMDQAGQQFERAGDVLWNRAIGLQNLQNETAVKKAALEYDTYAADQRIQYSQKMGDAANEDTFKAHIADLESKRQAMLDKLPNGDQKRMFDSETMRTIGRETTHAADHTSTQIRSSATNASMARINQMSDQYAKTDNIDETHDLHDRILKEFWSTQVPLRGWTKEQADEEWQKVWVQMNGSKITELSKTDPTRALKMLEDPENKKFMPAEKYVQVKNTILDNRNDQWTRNIADRVRQQNEDDTLEDRQKAGEKQAEEVSKGEPELLVSKLKSEVRRRIAVDWQEGEREKRQIRVQQEELALKAVHNELPNGKMATHIEDLWPIDGFKEAWDGMKQKSRDRIMKALERNAKGDFPETEDTRRLTHTLAMQAESPNAQEVDAFMKIDKESLHLPIKDRKYLGQLEMKIARREGFANPEVGRAWHVAGYLLPDGIRNKTSADWKDFAGSLSVALEDELKANKGIRLTDAQIIQIFGRLKATEPKTGWISYFDKEHYTIMSNPSDTALQQIKQQHRWMTDEEARRYFADTKWNTFQQHYRELQEGGPKAGPTSERQRPRPGIQRPAAQPKPQPPIKIPLSE